MGTFIWKDSYSVGISAMDDQHKKLVSLINKLNDAMSEGKGKEIIGQVLNEMAEYTAQHFKAEELLMQKYNYPGLAEQKKEHEAFIQKVNEMRQKIQIQSVSITIEISQFLRDWLTEHIMVVDKKYGSFLNNLGVK